MTQWDLYTREMRRYRGKALIYAFHPHALLGPVYVSYTVAFCRIINDGDEMRFSREKKIKAAISNHIFLHWILLLSSGAFYIINPVPEWKLETSHAGVEVVW